MAARRCSIDGVNYPSDFEYQTCPICGEKTDYFSNAEPDEDWATTVALATEHMKQDAIERPEIPVVDLAIRMFQGALVIHAWELYHAGHRDPLQPFDLIQVGKQVFEVIGYSKDRREYLVRVFSLELSDDELRRLADGP